METYCKMFNLIFLFSILAVPSYANEVVCLPGEVKYFSHPTQFGKFIACINGTQTLSDCPHDLVFNSEDQFCYHSNDVKKYAKKGIGRCFGQPNCPEYPNYPSYPTYPGYPTYPEYPTHPVQPIQPIQPIPPIYPEYPSYPSYPTSPSCPNYPGCSGCGSPEGTCPFCNDMCRVHFLRDSKDCSVFYMCNWGRPIWQRCPPGLHFNKNLDVCDYPWRAGCASNGPAPCQ